VLAACCWSLFYLLLLVFVLFVVVISLVFSCFFLCFVDLLFLFLCCCCCCRSYIVASCGDHCCFCFVRARSVVGDAAVVSDAINLLRCHPSATNDAIVCACAGAKRAVQGASGQSADWTSAERAGIGAANDVLVRLSDLAWGFWSAFVECVWRMVVSLGAQLVLLRRADANELLRSQLSTTGGCNHFPDTPPSLPSLCTSTAQHVAVAGCASLTFTYDCSLCLRLVLC